MEAEVLEIKSFITREFAIKSFLTKECLGKSVIDKSNYFVNSPISTEMTAQSILDLEEA